ncbi:TPA: hypothetical protein EYP66_12190 [Candidatus Poribacteria bacterium]|nr:hypothetical protein [Candidatus Poribacteria bacterium]
MTTQTPFNTTTYIIPVKMEVEGANGLKIANLLAALDTGASYTSIPWDIAFRLGYDPARSSRRQRITTGGGTVYVPLITVYAVRALGMREENIDVLCHDLPEESNLYCSWSEFPAQI